MKKRKGKKHADALVLPLWPDTGRKLGLGKNSTYAAAQRGEIPVLRFGRRQVVPKAALDRLLASAGSKAA